MSENITPETFPKYKPNPVLEGLPEYLKNPENYLKVQKALYEIGYSTCDHSEVIDWAGCIKCQRKQWDRKEMMRKLGFKSGAQYLTWAKVHQEIKRRMPLEKWK